MNNRPTYIASCSFGKDSLATILLALEHNEPLDRVVYCEVMFDHERGISGELPEHIEWVHNVAIPKLESWGVKVDVVKSYKDYVGVFYAKIGNRTKYPERIGKYSGWLLAGRCKLCSNKKDSLKRYFRKFNKVVQYVGIAIDEPKRLLRLDNSIKISLLAKYEYTEQMAMELCAKYGLISPIYKHRARNGCWFCPNNPVTHFAKLRKEYPQLWQQLKVFEAVNNKVCEQFTYSQTLADIESKMDAIDRQLKLF